MVINEYFGIENEDEIGSWKFIKSKKILDEVGIETEYQEWYNPNKEAYLFIYGDRELYNPENAAAHHMEYSEANANKWFDSFEGDGVITYRDDAEVEYDDEFGSYDDSFDSKFVDADDYEYDDVIDDEYFDGEV